MERIISLRQGVQLTLRFNNGSFTCETKAYRRRSLAVMKNVGDIPTTSPPIRAYADIGKSTFAGKFVICFGTTAILVRHFVFNF